MIIRPRAMHLPPGPAVIVTTHAAYAQHLPRVLRTINQQHPVAQRILVSDGFAPEATPELLGWTLVRVDAANPNIARNAGLEKVRAEWTIFWDGDNYMDKDYVETLWMTKREHHTGMIYPSLRYFSEDGRLIRTLRMPEWDYWTARRCSIVDTSSMWRAHALRSVGGFSPAQPRLDDYATALKITRAGWRGKASAAWANLTEHPHRRSNGNQSEALIHAWSFALLTLWSGRSRCESKVMKWIQRADLPPKLHLYWVDNSGNPAFTEWLHTCARILQRPVTIIQAGDPHQIKPGDHYLDQNRHQHVANLYNEALAHIHEDAVITLEDDVIPPDNGFRLLMEAFRPYGDVAASVGVYRSRTSPAHICAARNKDVWSNVPRFDCMPKEPFDVGMSGGGFAIYPNWALKAIGPMWTTYRGRYFMGWDGNLCTTMTRKGWRISADPRVKCEHRCKEVLDWLENPPELGPCPVWHNTQKPGKRQRQDPYNGY